MIGALIILYLATLHGGDGERRFARTDRDHRHYDVGGRRANPALRSAGAYCKLFFVLKLGDETDALARNAPASVRIRRDADGAFVANSEVNGEAMAMLIDSGAATVVLRQSDAERAGIDMSNLTFDTPTQNRKWHELPWRHSLEIRARRSACHRRRRSPRRKAGNS